MKSLIKIYKEARTYWVQILLSTLSLLMITGTSLFAPRLMQNMIKILETDGADESYMNRIITIALWLAVIYLIQSVMRYLNSYYCHVAAWNFVSDIRVKLYDHLQKLSLSYFSDKQTGQLLSRIMSDTTSLEVLIAHAIPELVGAITLFAGVTVILFVINWKLALLTCVPIPFILFMAPMLKKMRRKHKEAQIHAAELSGVLQDNLSGIKEIQIFNKQDYERKKVNHFSSTHVGSLLQALRYSAIFHPGINFFTSLGNVIVVVFGGLLALKYKTLETNEIVAFFMYLSMFYGPVSSFARILDDMQSGIACADRVFEILDTPSEVEEMPDAIDVPVLSGEVGFNNVSFAYKDDMPVISNISFKIPAKQMVAVVGATGVGKSTLASLLPRFYDTTEGNITIDGIDIKNMTFNSLRKNISVVLQDVFLFNGTIRDNILYGNDDANEENLIQAAKIACIYDFIESLPEKFDTMVGERGMRLSGGQKQRISIARSILCKSSVLIMDEATSAVDTETENQIKRAIASISGNRTMLVIAHRLSTVRSADFIIVLDNCKIAEIGTHDELIAQNGLYKHLVEMQNISE